MFAIVEHDENVFVSKKGNQALGGVGGMNRESERRRDRACNERWIGERRQIDESDAIIESCDQRVGDSHCNRRLADAARSDDRNETVLRQSRGEQYDDISSAHDVSERGGQPTEFRRRVGRHDRRNLRLQTLNRRDEAISPAWNVADVSRGALAVAQRLSKGCDMKLEIALLNELFGPDPGKKLVLGNDDAWPFHKHGENFKRSRAKPDWRLAVEQKPLVAKQTERPE
jgi:hypothetical protein